MNCSIEINNSQMSVDESNKTLFCVQTACLMWVSRGDLLVTSTQGSRLMGPQGSLDPLSRRRNDKYWLMRKASAWMQSMALPLTFN